MGALVLHSDTNPQANAALLEDMHRLRCLVFKHRLKWDVPCAGGLERDLYDEMSPTYMLFVRGGETVEGCWRLLPTTGPYMLKDIFGELLDEHRAPSDPAVWEISRFAVIARHRAYNSLAALDSVTSLLLAGLLEYCLWNNIERVVAASDVFFERVLRRSGLKVKRLGGVKRIGAVRSVAGWIDVDDDQLDRVLTRYFETAAARSDAFEMPVVAPESPIARLPGQRPPHGRTVRPRPAILHDLVIANDSAVTATTAL